MKIEIRESKRAKRLGITVKIDGAVVVTKPIRISTEAVEHFIESRREWFERTLLRFEGVRRREEKAGRMRIVMPQVRRGTRAHREAIAAARKLILERLTIVNQTYGFRYGSISIRSQKTRWGSCSTRGTLSFNYRLIYLPLPLVDYVIAHELCHLEQMNHSPAFWALVAQAVPDWKVLRKELRRYRF